VVRHLRTWVGDIVRLIHAVHGEWFNATTMPRVLRVWVLRCADAIALGLTSGNFGRVKQRDGVRQDLLSKRVTIKTAHLQAFLSLHSEKLDLAQQADISTFT
jgi:hypothetical protein